jgi:hypothetical protein
MINREIVPVGAVGQRIRKAFVAASLLAGASIASQLVRDPAWDGWWDAYNWPQLFLNAPVLFFLGATAWQLICLIAELFRRKAKRKSKALEPGALQDTQRTLRFWLRDSLLVSVLYITTAVIGDIPMAVNYLAVARGWTWHLWWSNAVFSCLLLMIAICWLLGRIQRFAQMRTATPD